MKNSKMLIVLFSVLLVAACREKAKVINQIDAGKLISATEVATSWNDSHRTKIVTTKGVFYVNSVVSTMTNIDVWIDEYDTGNRFICITGKKKCRQIVGN